MVSCKKHYSLLKNCINSKDVSKVVIEKPYPKPGVKITVTDKEGIDSLYDFFYNYEHELKGIYIIDITYRITFYSSEKKNVFFFNEENILRYQDSKKEYYNLENKKMGILVSRLLKENVK